MCIGVAINLYQWYDTFYIYVNSSIDIEIMTMPEDSRPTAPGNVANRLFFRLYQASNLLHKTGTVAVSEFGITTQQWAVLGALSRPEVRAEGMAVKDLLDFLMVSRHSVTAVLDRLERGGFLERTKTRSDGRIRKIRLTGKGEAVWQDMQTSIQAYYARALTDFTADERQSLVQMLDRLTSRLAQL